jgi:hypothetical protein
MDLSADALIPYPPQLVFAVCRDEMAKLAPYLPSILSIEVTSRIEHGPVVDNVIEWRAGADVPRVLRAMLGESVLSWTDHASWNADTLTCDWRTRMHVFTDAIACGAHDRFLPGGDSGTRLQIRGELAVDGRKLRGVPSFAAGRVARFMEEFLVSKIRTDLVKTAQGLARYLQARS